MRLSHDISSPPALCCALRRLRRRRLGADHRDRPARHRGRADLPGSPCQAVSRTTGYQAKVVDEPRHVRRARRRQDRRVDDHARHARQAPDRLLRRTTSAAASARPDGPAPRQARCSAAWSARARSSSSRRTSAQTVQFPLDRALAVKKGYVVALTVPTWAPALTPLLDDGSSWRASRAPRASATTTDARPRRRSSAQLAQYRCLYRGAADLHARR